MKKLLKLTVCLLLLASPCMAHADTENDNQASRELVNDILQPMICELIDSYSSWDSGFWTPKNTLDTINHNIITLLNQASCALSCITCEENENNNQEFITLNDENIEEDFVSIFIRKCRFISFLTSLAPNMDQRIPDKTYVDFALYEELWKKDQALLKAEQKNAPYENRVFQNPGIFEPLRTITHEHLAAGDNITQTRLYLINNNEAIKKHYKNVPATIDSLISLLVSECDKDQLFIKLFGKDYALEKDLPLRIYLSQYLLEQSIADAKLTRSEFNKSIDEIYIKEMEEYNQFMANNKDAFEQLSKFINDKFKMNTTFKKCVTTKNKQYCTEDNGEREIKSLSEITPYIRNLKTESN